MMKSISDFRTSVLLARFARCQRGGVAVFFGISLVAIVGMVGAAVDYAQLVRMKSGLQASLDAAALSAVQATNITEARVVLQRVVAAGAVKDSAERQLTTTVTSFDGSTLQATASVNVALTFGKMVGLASSQVLVNSSATRAAGYQELYFAVDLSGSLGMAATDADRANLETLTRPYVPAFYGARLPQGCAFACHRREGWEPGALTVYDMAKAVGIRLREDELMTQFNGLVDLLLDPTDPNVIANMRSLSVIGFSNSARQLLAPSQSATALKASLATFPAADRFETNFTNAFTEINRLMGAQGTGAAGSPTKMLVLITDGINSRDAFFAQSPIDTALCATVKNNGFKLAVIELKYPVLTANALYDDTVLPVKDRISPALQTCATPGWYFQAITNDDVPVKFRELKSVIASSATRLSR